jgi:hypothetical protein
MTAIPQAVLSGACFTLRDFSRYGTTLAEPEPERAPGGVSAGVTTIALS